MLLAPGLPGALFLNIKNSNYKASKELKKNPDVANCIHYDHENFQYEILCYVGWG
jgi:hypothetical protein